MTATSYAPLRAGNGGVITEQLDALPASGTSAIGVSASGKLSLFDSLTSDQTVALVAAAIAAIPEVDLSSKLDLSATTAFTRSLLDDADAATARTTLGLGSGDSPTFADMKLPKNGRVYWGDFPNFISLTDSPTWYDSRNNVMTFGVFGGNQFTGAWVFHDWTGILGNAMTITCEGDVSIRRQAAIGAPTGVADASRVLIDADTVGHVYSSGGDVRFKLSSHGPREGLTGQNGGVLLLGIGANLTAISSGGEFGIPDFRVYTYDDFTAPALVVAPFGGDAYFKRDVFASGRISAFKSNVSSTNFEALTINAAAVDGSTPVYRIGSRIGEAGGATRGLQFGNWNAAETWTNWININANGDASLLNTEIRGKLSNWDSYAQRYELVPHGGVAYGLEYNGLSVDGGVLKLGFGDGCSYIAGGQQSTGIFHVFVGSVVSPRLTIFGDGTVLIPGNVAISGFITANSLPTSDPGVAGRIWRSGNDLKISTG